MILTGCIGVRMIMTIDEAIQDWEDRKAFLQRTCEHCWDEPAEMALQALKEKRELIRKGLIFCKDCVYCHPFINTECRNTGYYKCSSWGRPRWVLPDNCCSFGRLKEEDNK